MANKKSDIKQDEKETKSDEVLPEDDDEIKIFTGDVIEMDSSAQSSGNDFLRLYKALRGSNCIERACRSLQALQALRIEGTGVQ